MPDFSPPPSSIKKQHEVYADSITIKRQKTIDKKSSQHTVQSEIGLDERGKSRQKSPQNNISFDSLNRNEN